MNIVDMKSVLKDRSVQSLIFVNILTIVFALIDNWNLFDILFIYWCQSVIIGIFNFLRIMTSKIKLPKKISKNKLKDKGKIKKISYFFRIFYGLFFLFHYGGFHFIYLMFISDITANNISSITTFVLIHIGIYFINHAFSFFHNMKDKSKKELHVKHIFKAPYKRIIPMHLTLMFGFMTTLLLGLPQIITLVFFLILKTIIDVASHMHKHK